MLYPGIQAQHDFKPWNGCKCSGIRAADDCKGHWPIPELGRIYHDFCVRKRGPEQGGKASAVTF